MYIEHGTLVFSPSDLTLYIDSPFASWMEHLSLIAPERTPERDAINGMLQVLQEKGGEHEAALLQYFQQQYPVIVNIRQENHQEQATLRAMQTGADIIYQACLSNNHFRGYADFLIKTSGTSKLGDYHYEVWDTKLSKTLKPAFTVQLCCYQELLEGIQGRRSKDFVIVLGDGTQHRLRTDDFYFYYESTRESFLAFHQAFDKNQLPDPADSQAWGEWETYAKHLLKEADHPSLVANITRTQLKKLKSVGITTMSDLAQTKLERINGIHPSVLARLTAQAAIQKNSEGLTTPLHQILKSRTGEKQGLALLPPHSNKDIFFDIEGFPLQEGGLEYLWGVTYFDDKGVRCFKDFWAHTHEQEKIAFRSFIEWVYSRWQEDPNMHIYHYAHYEIAACRKLMSKYGICEYEVDQLLRNEVFVDLYKIVKNGLLIGEPKYSIKNVEHLYRGKRITEVGSGGDSVIAYESWRRQPDGETWETSTILNNLREYNIDDCNSTQELVEWLRQEQQKNQIDYLGRSETVEAEISEEITSRITLRDNLLEKANAMRDDDITATFTENLAWFLEFHRREAKPVFWRLFDRLGLSDSELFDDIDCLSGCERTDKDAFKATPTSRNLSFEYRFNPNQEFKLANTTTFYVLGEENSKGERLKVTVVKEYTQLSNGIITLQAKEEPPPTLTLIPDEYVRPDPIPQSLEFVINNYIQTNQRTAIIDFLKRDYPRIKGHVPGKPIAQSDDTGERLKQIIHAVLNLENSYLPIQGPPGSGKTYTAKHIIAALLRQGKRVGISSNSHKAINNLLIGTVKYCQENDIHGFFACTKDTDEAIKTLNISVIENKKISEYATEPCVIGTTAWGFSRSDVEQHFDYLFVDEAGQVSVANLIAMSRSCQNIVLMGDQMQLGQPAQGTHPADSGLSTLDYLLRHTPTISDDRGVFLGTTYRMHSKVNQFISNAIYEGKLNAHPDNDLQRIDVPNDYQGLIDKTAGIIFIPVFHEGNTQASDEEVEVIKLAANDLMGRTFTDKTGLQRPISIDDMLFVAPYNFQVNKLREAIGPNAKVGSVDKFQGQEAPIVFFSLCASNANDSPRGLDFLFDKNRMNVAISRAQCLAIVVGNPLLKSTSTHNIEQQTKVNLFCKLLNYK